MQLEPARRCGRLFSDAYEGRAGDEQLANAGARQAAELHAFAREVGESLWTAGTKTFLERVMPKHIAAFLAGEDHRYVDELAMCRTDGSVVWTEARSYLATAPVGRRRSSARRSSP